LLIAILMFALKGRIKQNPGCNLGLSTSVSDSLVVGAWSNTDIQPFKNGDCQEIAPLFVKMAISRYIYSDISNPESSLNTVFICVNLI